MVGLQFRNFNNVNFQGNLNQRNQNSNQVQSHFAPIQGDKVSFTKNPKNIARSLNRLQKDVFESNLYKGVFQQVEPTIEVKMIPNNIHLQESMEPSSEWLKQNLGCKLNSRMRNNPYTPLTEKSRKNSERKLEDYLLRTMINPIHEELGLRPPLQTEIKLNEVATNLLNVVFDPETKKLLIR